MKLEEAILKLDDLAISPNGISTIECSLDLVAIKYVNGGSTKFRLPNNNEAKQFKNYIMEKYNLK